MATAAIDLRANAQQVFAPEEWGIVLGTMYNILNRAVQDYADTLRMDATEIVWQREGVTLGSFPLTIVTPTRSHRSALEQILARDPLVRQHVQIQQATEHEIVCLIQ